MTRRQRQRPDRTSATVVVHVFGSMARGGAELRTLEAVEEIPPDEVQSVFVCLSGRRGELAARAESLGGRVVPLPLGPTFPARFVQLLRGLDADVVHSHVATFSGFIVTLARLAGVPRRICHFRSDGDAHGTGLARRWQRRVMRGLASVSATNVVGVSPGALTHGWRREWSRDRRCVVVPNGLSLGHLPVGEQARQDVRERWGVPPQARLVVFVGKSTAAKDVGRAIRLAHAVSVEDPRVRFLFVGPYSQEDEAAIASSRSERVRSVGVREDVVAILHAADLTLLTSRREGLPGVVLESLAVGTPVLASDLPGTRWIGEMTAGISLVPTDGPDPLWQERLLAAIRSADGTDRRQAVRAAFGQSPFLLERNVTALRTLWSVEARERAHRSPSSSRNY